MAEEQTTSVLSSSGAAGMAEPARISPASDADGVEPASPEPMDTSGAESRAADTGSTSPGAGATGKPGGGPVRRRNRPALSCIQCRTRKVRCDRNEPCNSCLKSKIVNCTYEEARRPKPKFWKLSPGEPPGPGAHDAAYSEVQFSVGSNGHRNSLTPGHHYAASAAPAAGAGVRATDSAGSPALHAHSDRSAHAAHTVTMPPPEESILASRVRELEERLAEALKKQDPSHSSNPSIPAVLSKTRYFGASHWMNKTKLFPLMMGLADRLEGDKNSEIFQVLDKCKKLGRLIKSRRTPASLSFEIGKTLPPEPTAFRLVEAYFRTFETVYRILHIPTFWAEYRKVWNDPSAVDRAFIIQLQLCMAIGSCFQDDVTSLRASATQWVYEAQHWIASPFEKSRMNVAGLQVMCLMHLAREACGVGGDLTWISLGATLRTAMFMGLHRDPEHLPTMPILASELRRRLWATILEMVVQSSLGSGGPPLLSLADFDTRPPSNYDDDQLVETNRFSTGPRPPGTFTQTSVQIALLKSFAVRLSIAQYINDIHVAPTYDETLRRNSELTVACRTLSATLQPFYDPAGVIPNRVSLFQLQMTEHMMHRFFLSLNSAWMLVAEDNPAYYFARKMSVETSLKLYRSSIKGSSTGDSSSPAQVTDFTRVSIAGAGAFRAVPLQSLSTIAIELLWQIKEDQSFRQNMSLDQPGLATDSDPSGSGSMGSGVAPRSELIETLNYAQDWMESRLRCGETNIKGYVFGGALKAQVEAAQRGATDTEIENYMIERVVVHCRHSLAILQEIVGGAATPSDIGDFTSISGGSIFDGNDFDGFGLPNNTSNDWGWAWDDMGFNLNNFNANMPGVGPGTGGVLE